VHGIQAEAGGLPLVAEIAVLRSRPLSQSAVRTPEVDGSDRPSPALVQVEPDRVIDEVRRGLWRLVIATIRCMSHRVACR
jgi:hypothetical protein